LHAEVFAARAGDATLPRAWVLVDFSPGGRL